MEPGDHFALPFPIYHNNLSNQRNNSPPVLSTKYGEHEVYNPNRSPIVKPTGRLADFGGPKPDLAEELAAPTPVSTRMRIGTQAKARK